MSAGLAGQLAAHAMWSVSEAEPVSPILGVLNPDGTARMERLISDDTAAAVESARARFEDPGDVAALALVFDGILTSHSGKRYDALTVEFAQWQPAEHRFTMAVPYRPAPEFAVYRPKLMLASTQEQDTVSAFVEAFYAGVDSHDPGGRIWNEHLQDASIS